jgi:hypothetical protein
MSIKDFREYRLIREAYDPSFKACIMAAFHKAGPGTLEPLHHAFPKLYDEWRERLKSKNYLLEGERDDE